jgi:hypothetical protein
MRRKVPRTLPSEVRRVTRDINAALVRIQEIDPLLSRTLREAIKTGQFLSYIPSPGAVVSSRKSPRG